MKKIIWGLFILAIILAIGMISRWGEPRPGSHLSEQQARVIAQESCIKGGEALGEGQYNEITKTWWYDANLNATRPGCMPACVVSEETKTAEINWRCTGLVEPE